MSAPKQSLPWLAIYNGQTCVGHVLSRGPKGFEAFDADDKSIGIYPTQDDAVNAIDRQIAETKS